MSVTPGPYDSPTLFTPWLQARAAQALPTHLPRGTFSVYRTIVPKQGWILTGAGRSNTGSDPAATTRLNWTGPTTENMIQFRLGSDRFRLSDLVLVGSGDGIGTVIGVGNNPGGAGGTQGSGGRFERCGIGNADTGVQIGALDGSNGASEVLFDQCDFGTATRGVGISCYNSLNFKFNNCNWGPLFTGVQVFSGGQIYIDGGSASSCGGYVDDTDFGALIVSTDNNAGVMSLRNFRFEVCPSGCLVRCEGPAVPIVVLDGISSLGGDNENPAGNRYAVVARGKAKVSMRGCIFADMGGIHYKFESLGAFTAINCGFSTADGMVKESGGGTLSRLTNIDCGEVNTTLDTWTDIPNAIAT